MKISAFRVAAGAAIILIAAILNGCNRYIVRETNESAGFNGGFEIVNAGLPVNWYLPEGIKQGEVEISLDPEDAVEGKQSLKLLVHRADPAGIWPSARLFQVFQPAKANHSYKVSFWLKNQGCDVRLIIRNEGKDPVFGPSEAVKKDLAGHPPIEKTLGEEETGTNTWRQFEFIYAVPETDGSIRFEMNIMQPGTLWLDDVRIEEVRTD